MRRLRNWDVELAQLARAVTGETFEWGTTDCASLVLRGVEVMYGEQIIVSGKWTTRTGALRAWKKIESADRVLEAAGATRVKRAFWQSGDVLLTPGPDEHGLPRLALAIPAQSVLVADLNDGVRIVKRVDMEDGTYGMRLPYE